LEYAYIEPEKTKTIGDDKKILNFVKKMEILTDQIMSAWWNGMISIRLDHW
jgi:hypothetical protein